MGGGYYVYSYGNGYSFSRSMTSELLIEALQNACLSQKTPKGLYSSIPILAPIYQHCVYSACPKTRNQAVFQPERLSL